MRWFKAAGGLLVIMLIVTSCIKVEGTVKIEDDGSGSVDFLSALNTEALTGALGDFDVSEDDLGGTEELCSGFEDEFGDTDGLPSGAQVTPYSEDGFCGTRVTYDLAASTDHSDAIKDLFDDTTRLYKEGDNWFFDSDFSADDITSEADGAPPEMMAALFDGASFKITIDLPGRAVEGQSNATDVGSDGKFTWDIDLLNPPDRLFAQTEPGSGGGSGGGGFSPLLIGLIVVALGAALTFFLLNKQKKDKAAAELAGGMPGDPAVPGAPAPMAAPDQLTAPGAMPLAAPGATPPAPAGMGGAPVMPASDAAKETVLINPADAQRLAAGHLEDVAGDAASDVTDAATNAAETAADAAADAGSVASAPEPVYDEALAAWTIEDPTRGRLRHDPATDTWNPI